MIVPTEEALQELWISHRVERAEREHRPHPDYSLFVAEFKTAMNRIKADAWDEGYDQAHEDLANDGFGEFQSPNPYREQEEA